MFVDKVKRIMDFSINGKRLGHAFKNLDFINKNYYPAVYLQKNSTNFLDNILFDIVTQDAAVTIKHISEIPKHFILWTYVSGIYLSP